MSDAQFIGLDMGRSAVKVVARKGDKEFHVSFPSAVMEAARSLVFDDLAASAEADTVTVAGQDYWTGETALRQGIDREPIGRSDEWVTTKTHDALTLSAIQRLNDAGLKFNPAKATVVLGVPSRVLRDRRDLVASMRDQVIKLLSDGKSSPQVIVLAQPMGVIAAHTMTPDGQAKEGFDLDRQSFAVIDVGQYTTDYVAVVEGVPIVDAADSSEGVEVIALQVKEQLGEMGFDLGARDLQRMMLNPKIRKRGQDIDLKPMIQGAVASVLAPKIIQVAKGVFKRQLLQDVDSVLIAGGGAPWVVDQIKVDPDMVHAVQVENPREAVADGFARMAAAIGEGAGNA